MSPVFSPSPVYGGQLWPLVLNPQIDFWSTARTTGMKKNRRRERGLGKQSEIFLLSLEGDFCLSLFCQD